MSEITGALLYEQLKKSDIFVLSSITEGFPRVLYESMAMRLPVITTDVGGIPYLLEDQKSALIVPSKDEDSLAIAMDKMITNGELRRSIIFHYISHICYEY